MNLREMYESGMSISQIAKDLGLRFVPELENGNVCFANNNEDLRDDFSYS